MPALLFPLICSLLTVPADTLERPAAIVAAVTRAIEGDSATNLESRWNTRLGRDSTDRAALFGLATLNRLRYAFPMPSGYTSGCWARTPWPMIRWMPTPFWAWRRAWTLRASTRRPRQRWSAPERRPAESVTQPPSVKFCW